MVVPHEAVRAAALVLSCTEGQYDEDDYRVAGDMLEAAAPAIRAAAVAAERDRIRQLAIRHHALYLAGGVPDDGEPSGLMPFADLLEDPAAQEGGS